MGYETRYELSSDDECIDAHISAIRVLSGYEYLFDDDCTWYDHEKNMVEYSSRFPGVQFTLTGEGEESGDIWVKWFKNGHVQLWQLKYEVPIQPPASW